MSRETRESTAGATTTMDMKLKTNTGEPHRQSASSSAFVIDIPSSISVVHLQTLSADDDDVSECSISIAEEEMDPSASSGNGDEQDDLFDPAVLPGRGRQSQLLMPAALLGDSLHTACTRDTRSSSGMRSLATSSSTTDLPPHKPCRSRTDSTRTLISANASSCASNSTTDVSPLKPSRSLSSSLHSRPPRRRLRIGSPSSAPSRILPLPPSQAPPPTRNEDSSPNRPNRKVSFHSSQQEQLVSQRVRLASASGMLRPSCRNSLRRLQPQTA